MLTTSSPLARLRPVILLCALIGMQALAGCSWFSGDKTEDEDTTEQQLYRTAQLSLRAANYDEAVKRLQALEARFPFGRYAEQAQLETIYAYYMAYEPERARSAADRFIRLHPQHSRVDYAHYLKGLAAFNKDRGLLDSLAPSSLALRDPGAARDSFADFSQLVGRFPDSPYAHDARQRMIYLRNVLAQAEVEIARYYIRRGAWVAAANRGRFVIENFDQTPVVAEALAIMVEAYSHLGQPALANDTLRILAMNYPNYPAFDANGDFVRQGDIRNQDRSWLNLVTLGLLDRPDVSTLRVPQVAAVNDEPAQPVRRAEQRPQDAATRSALDSSTNR